MRVERKGTNDGMCTCVRGGESEASYPNRSESIDFVCRPFPPSLPPEQNAFIAAAAGQIVYAWGDGGDNGQ